MSSIKIKGGSKEGFRAEVFLSRGAQKHQSTGEQNIELVVSFSTSAN